MVPLVAGSKMSKLCVIVLELARISDRAGVGLDSGRLKVSFCAGVIGNSGIAWNREFRGAAQDCRLHAYVSLQMIWM